MKDHSLKEEISYYRKQLQFNHTAINYLKNRDIKASTVNEFKIGYSPVNTVYDKMWANRIIIPVQNAYGKYIALVGRSIDSATKPKYINSYESVDYRKGKTLFGYNKALPYIQKSEYTILLEGQFDFLTLWQHNIQNIVACSGTGITAAHVRLMGRYSKYIVTMFDGDEAGAIGTKKVKSLADDNEINAISIGLPDKHDPESFIKQYGKSKLLHLIDKEKKVMENFIYER